MKYHQIVIAVVILLLAFASCQNNHNETAFFTNLTGSWQIIDKPIIETWQKGNHPDTGFTAQVLETVENKFLLRETISITHKNGKTYFNALVNQQNAGNAITFELTRVAPNEAVFENPTHNYPQKITYQLKDNNQTLVTDISGKMDGEEKRFTFTHKRKK
ncbi:MAG TPA: DUF6265 family protein [Chitinophagales bacterium]|nr:DUF6265 family protein [Chitinophagales bacterium]